MKIQARAIARAPVHAKIQFSKTLTNYVSKQKNHHEKSPKPTIQASFIETFSQNEILFESDWTICFLWYKAIEYTLRQNETKDGPSSVDLSLMPEILKLFAMNAQTHVILRKKSVLGTWLFDFL